MADIKKPMMRVRIGDGDSAPVRTLQGRDAWLCKKLIERGDRGVTPIDEIGPRASHYAFKLRRAGIVIETVTESHGGPFAGTHGRYLLRTPLTILEEANL